MVQETALALDNLPRDRDKAKTGQRRDGHGGPPLRTE